MLNIHPSLLPAYPGLDTHARAIAAGDSYGGTSVHLVTEELDAGEILGQIAIAIQPVVPEKAAAVLDQLGVADANRSYADLGDAEWFGALVAAGHAIDKPTPVFPRLEPPEAEPA